MDLKKYIPFEKKEFREGQEDAVDQILQSINNHGNKFTILNAPVGAGKSLIGYVIAKYLEEQGGYTYMCTGTKILQDQYLKDFSDIRTIKGRMNFLCNVESLFPCSKGMCQSHSKYRCDYKPMLKEKWSYDDLDLPDRPIMNENNEMVFYGDKEFDDIFTKDMCPYWKQKIEGIMNPITILNYDYLISDSRFVKHLPYRRLLICDEGHNIEKILMRQLETKFSPSVVKRKTGYNFKNSQTILDWASEVAEIADLYKDLEKGASADIDKTNYHKAYEKFSALCFLLEESPTNWVFMEEKNNGHVYYVFKPITVSEYTDIIFNLASHVLIMTGTVLKQDVFARDLGIDNFEYIEIPSIIPAKNRPIIKLYVGSMARSSVDVTMPNMIRKIKMLAEKHQDEKGVIHTFTYAIAQRFRQNFKNDNRFMFHNQKNKEDVFERFKEDKTNKILVSPVAFEGVDFPYDQARWQCICKEPFPNMMDPQISVRDSVDFDWVFRQRCLVLSQMYGRTNRAPDDFSVTYLLDSRIETLLGPSSLVTDYFLEALQGEMYNDKLILNSDAYERLTKDNSRKTHEFDREVERNVLDDIKNGFDTLSSLRKAYKEFDSDAYKYISPAVERLLKHKAIRYA